MAADESQFPATSWPSKSWCVELSDNLNKAVAMGIADGTDDTVAEVLASLANEIAGR
jgi:hypothetical protein